MEDTFEEHTLEEFLSACAEDPEALLICTNALDPDRDDTRTGNILAGLGPKIFDLPLFGTQTHGASSSCSHSASEVTECRDNMMPFKQLIDLKQDAGMLLVLGKQAKMVLVDGGEPPIAPRAVCLPFPSLWNHAEETRSLVWKTLRARLENFMTYDAFKELLHDSHTTSTMRTASAQTMSWVKHLPSSDAQKAAASITGTRTIGFIKHLPATENTKRAAANNGRCENSRKAVKITGDTIGKFNFAAVKLRAGFRDQWRLDTVQASPQILADLVAQLQPGEEDLLFMAHKLCKQRGHLLINLNDAVKAGVLEQSVLDTLTKIDKDKDSRRGDVDKPLVTHLYGLGLSLWQAAWMNPVPVASGDVRLALSMTEAARRLYEKNHPRLKRGKPPQEVIDAIKALPHVNAWRAAAAFTVNGSSIKKLIDFFE